MASAGLSQNDRIKASAGVIIFHALIGYAFVTGLGMEFVRETARELKVFNIVEPPPPPEEEIKPSEVATEAPEGEAAPPSLKAKPTPVVAPPPKVDLKVPPPIVTAKEPSKAPPGNDPTAGASDRDGTGTGAGGFGSGTGSGGQGTGSGGGGGARAQLIRGRLMNQDYPRSALRAGIEGVVHVRYTVGTSGRVSGCRVTRSSGNEALDSTTCRLIERRFVYRPAKDSSGRPTTETVNKVYEWLLPFRQPLPLPPAQ